MTSKKQALSSLSPQLADAARAVEADSAKAVDNLATMIAVDTSFPPGQGYQQFAELMERLTTPLGFSHERITVPRELWHVPGGPASGERVNLIARRPTGKPVLGLYYHVDTVPAAPGWVRDPFRLTEESGRLYGLGAADMKGTIAATLLALESAERCNVELAYDPMLLFCTDEEAGLYPGIRYLAEQGCLEGHILNFNGSAAPRVWAGSFGLFSLLVRLTGQAVHAGEGNRTGKGINAIESALPILNALNAMKDEVGRFESALPPPPHADGPLRPQLTISSAHGGSCAGQVPAQFEILVTRRYAPEEDFDRIRAEIEAVLNERAAQVPGLGIEIDLVSHLLPTSNPDGPHWPRWQEALSLGFGYAPTDFRKWGASSCSDFGYVQRVGAMQEVLLGGLGRPESCIHSPDEHTTVDDVTALATSILAYLAHDFATDRIPENS